MSANAQTTMTISDFKDTAVLLSPETSILLRANHGVGKSKVVRQVSATLRKTLKRLIAEGASVTTPDGTVVDLTQYREAAKKAGFFPVIDRRLSQMTEGDMVGLPSTEGEVTRFNPPDWYKKACLEPCVLFLDEMNRATQEVMQAGFQIVLDRELNGWKLHPLTRVCSAINMGAAYTVNEMDPALNDRFWIIDLDPTLEDWVIWARDKDPEQGGNMHPCLPDFMTATKRSDGTCWLYPAKKADANSKQPSPRSWAAVNRELVYSGLIENPKHPAFYRIVRGFVGNEAAIAFTDFCKTIDRQISGKEVLEEYDKQSVKDKVAASGMERQNEIIERVATYVLENVPALNERQGKNLADLMRDLPQELRVSLWGKVTGQGLGKAKLAMSIHKHCMPLVCDVFGVKPGEQGIGQVPNVPGIFKIPPKDAAPGKPKAKHSTT